MGRVARTMDLQEDIAAKIEIIKKNAEVEKGLLPQGAGVDKDAQAFKDELAESPSMLLTWMLTPRLNVASIPMTSSTGLSTGLVSRNSLPGCSKPRRPPMKVLSNLPASMRLRHCTTRLASLTRLLYST